MSEVEFKCWLSDGRWVWVLARGRVFGFAPHHHVEDTQIVSIVSGCNLYDIDGKELSQNDINTRDLLNIEYWADQELLKQEVA